MGFQKHDSIKNTNGLTTTLKTRNNSRAFHTWNADANQHECSTTVQVDESELPYTIINTKRKGTCSLSGD
jgi:hypothetical protein